MRQTDSLEAALEKRRLRQRLPRAEMRRLLRRSAELPQEAIAEAVGVDRATVSRWESGEREPRDEHVVRYLEVLDRLARESA